MIVWESLCAVWPCITGEVLKKEWCRLSSLLYCDFNFLGDFAVVFVAFEGYCCLIGSLFLKVFDFKGCFTLLVGFCLVGFALDFQGEFHLFHCLSDIVFKCHCVFFDLFGLFECFLVFFLATILALAFLTIT